MTEMPGCRGGRGGESVPRRQRLLYSLPVPQWPETASQVVVNHDHGTRWLDMDRRRQRNLPGQGWTIQAMDGAGRASDTRVNYLCEDSDGVIWAGLQSGIVRLKNNQIRNIGPQRRSAG